MTLELANRLVRFRKESGLSQEEVAEKIGVSRQAVSKWERTEASPDTDNLIALAGLYGVSLDSLVFGSQAAPAEVPAPAKEDPVDDDDDDDEDDDDDDDGGRWSVRILRVVSAYPVLVAAVYIGLGLSFALWHPGWIIFITAPVYYIVADGLKKRKR